MTPMEGLFLFPIIFAAAVTAVVIGGITTNFLWRKRHVG